MLRRKCPRYRPYLLALLVALFALPGCGEQSADTASTDASEPLEATDDPARTEAELPTTVQPVTQTSLEAEEELAPQGTVVTVDEVMSGDTIRVSPAVDDQRVVRLIGIDAPETGGQPFGDPARAQANSIIGGRQVALGFDTRRMDQSGRLLAYVRLPGGDLFNEFMVRAGYAQVDISPPNVRFEEELRAAQREARDNNIGIWGLPPEQRCQLADRGNDIGGGCENLSSATDSSSSGGSAPEDELPVAAPPPVPPDGDYDCGHFNDQQQAQEVLDSDPSDPHGLDEDQNDIACDSAE